MRARFKLPAGVTCERCVIQMWWITANSCTPPNYREFDFPDRWDTCDGDGGTGWFSPGFSDCVGSTKAEEFWNCADVSIIGSSEVPSPFPSPAPSPSPSPNPGPSPSPSPTTFPPPTSGGFYCGWDSCKSRGSEWCDFSKDRCVGSCSGEWCPQDEASPSPSPSVPPASGDGCCQKLTLPEYGFVYGRDTSVCAAATWNSGENARVCVARANYNTAEDTCASIGARLCTHKELQNGEGAGAGCSLDRKKVWTSTQCETNKGKAGFLVAKGRNGRGKKCKRRSFRRAAMICCADTCSTA